MPMCKVQDKLKKYLTQTDCDRVNSLIENYVTCFLDSNIDKEQSEVYVVIKNTGQPKIFTTIKGYIVFDKLDNSYSESRELLGVASWNVKKIFKINLATESTISTVPYKDLKRLLFQVVTPSKVRYNISQKDTEDKVLVKVDSTTLNSLKHKEIKKCVDDAYIRLCNNDKLNKDALTDLVYCIVDYE